mgnify:CR=1 FL=1
MQVSRETFVIYQSHLQPNGQLSVPALASFMQEAAWKNVKDIGVSTEKLLKQDMAWVLTRMQWECHDTASHRQEVVVETWPSGSDKYYFYRDFRIYEKERLIATITTTWILISLSKRQLRPVPDFLSKLSYTHDKDPMVRASGKITNLKEVSSKQTVEVNWHQLDVNRHTNNTYYLQWIIESIPTSILQKASLLKLDVIFKSESKLKDCLTINLFQESKAEFKHSIVNTDGKELVLAKSVWA